MTHPTLPTFEHMQKLPLGFRFPARMTVLPLAGRKLALISPVPIDEARAAALAELGEVAFLIAPNLMHHLYLGDAARRYPGARVLAPRGLVTKRPDLRIDSLLDEELPRELGEAVAVLRIEGAPRLDEFVFHHPATRSLVVTDLVFNIRQPRGWLAHLLLFLGGTHGRLASSRIWRFLAEDRASVADSVERILALPFDTLLVAHGDVVTVGAHAQLERALRGLSPARRALPTSRQAAIVTNQDKCTDKT
jgi:hypothetical protein